MDTFLQMSAEDRHKTFVQVEERMGLQAASVEKDLWVCWVLRGLASVPDLGRRLTFKGGTSLSKGWGLIDRFSEDIDIVIDRDALGYGGDDSPEAAKSKSQRKRQIEQLIAACGDWVQHRLQPAFLDFVSGRLGPPGSTIKECSARSMPGTFDRS